MTTCATEWVFTSPLEFDDSETRRLHQGSFRVLPSPYANPVAMRVIYGQRDGRLLELRYLSTEPLIRGEYAGGAVIEYGKKTRRPWSIYVPISDKDGITSFISKIDQALDSYLRVHEGASLTNPHSLGGWKATVKNIKALIRRHQVELNFDAAKPN